MNKTIPVILSAALLIAIGIVFLGNNKSNDVAKNQEVKNVEIKDGIQYITITARGGYSPRISAAQSGIPTKLIMETNGTYDCSAALAIHSIGYQKILPQTGETEIDLGTHKAGEIVQGVCGMGMYSFKIDFDNL